MPLSSCLSGGLAVTALATLLLLPAQYYVPEFRIATEDTLAEPEPLSLPPPRSLAALWHNFQLVTFPTLDLFFAVSLLLLVLFTYICEWIQRKLMERRIVKLNQYLGASVERLRSWDAQQEQLESTLKVVQTATSEYNLLYLLLRQRRCLAYDGRRASL